MRQRQRRRTRLGVGTLARLTAILAMLFQALLFAEHLGASAVAASGTMPPGARGGFMQICTGEGIRLVPVNGAASSAGGASGAASSCAICTSPGVCGFDAPAALTALAVLPSDFTPLTVHHDAQRPPILRALSDGPARAPPRLRV